MKIWLILYIMGHVAASLDVTRIHPEVTMEVCQYLAFQEKEDFKHATEFLKQMEATPEDIDMKCIRSDTKPEITFKRGE